MSFKGKKKLNSLSFNSKAQVNINKTIFSITGIVITIIIILSTMSVLTPEAQTAGDTLEATGVPLGSLFAGQGVIILLFMVGIFLLVIQSTIGLRLGREAR